MERLKQLLEFIQRRKKAGRLLHHNRIGSFFRYHK